jgi:hypothetical protein
MTPLVVHARRVISWVTGSGYKDWLTPFDPEYPEAMERLFTHPEITEFCARIVPHTLYGEQPDDITLPTIHMETNGDIELAWPNVLARFRHDGEEFRFVPRDSEWPWTADRPDGKIMVTV